MLISIIMPVRNTERYLRKCLDSILNQSEGNWELIAVENNSDDGCLEILREYAAIDKRIQVYHNPNGDLITAVRMAAFKASGTLITRMDSDDIMPINRLEIQKQLLVDHGPGHIATGKVRYFSEDKEILGYKRYEDWLNHLMETEINYQQVYKECVIPSPCWMMYKKDFDRVGGFDFDIYPEDYDLCFRLYKHGIKVIASKEILHYWRDYHHRNSRTDPNYADQLFFDLKLGYFLELDYNPQKKLVLWGMGKKGKNLAKKLIEEGVEFDWVTENPNKIGKVIYDKLILTPADISENSQVIIVVSNEEEQKDINKRLEKEQVEYYNFC